MAKASHTINGKAFEYACLRSLLAHAKALDKDVSIEANKAFVTAEKAFSAVDDNAKTEMMAAANTAVKLIVPLEPKLMGGSGTLLLTIATDAAAIGVDGDVRDVLCVRADDEEWTIGISCKHNHEGLRHPRITEGKDFGSDWIGVHCSREFMDEITPITNSLIENSENGTLWSQIDQKWDRYYVPILTAYLKEIQRMCNEDPTVPEKLLSYFFGANDFYKVIMKSGSRTTTVEGFNMHGTLNVACGKTKAMTKVPVIKMPTRLLDATFKAGTKTTIILTFDGGWSISMRLHNKDKIAKPTSLAWEVYLEGLPPSTYVNMHSWDE